MATHQPPNKEYGQKKMRLNEFLSPELKTYKRIKSGVFKRFVGPGWEDVIPSTIVGLIFKGTITHDELDPEKHLFIKDPTIKDPLELEEGQIVFVKGTRDYYIYKNKGELK